MAIKFLIFTIFLGVVCAEPLRKSFSSSDVIYYADSPSYEIVSQPDTSDLVLHLLNTFLSYKSSALNLAVYLIEWVMSNMFIMAFGATAVIGYCKLVGCNFNYEQYIPVSQIQAYATPENLQSAETFLISAINKYAQKKKREVKESS